MDLSSEGSFPFAPTTTTPLSDDPLSLALLASEIAYGGNEDEDEEEDMNMDVELPCIGSDPISAVDNGFFAVMDHDWELQQTAKYAGDHSYSGFSLYPSHVPSIYANSLQPEQDRINDFVYSSQQIQPLTAAVISCGMESSFASRETPKRVSR